MKEDTFFKTLAGIAIVFCVAWIAATITLYVLWSKSPTFEDVWEETTIPEEQWKTLYMDYLKSNTAGPYPPKESIDWKNTLPHTEMPKVWREKSNPTNEHVYKPKGTPTRNAYLAGAIGVSVSGLVAIVLSIKKKR